MLRQPTRYLAQPHSIWVRKFEAGAFDNDAQAADLLQDYEAKIAALERMVGRQALEIQFPLRIGGNFGEGRRDDADAFLESRGLHHRPNRVRYGGEEMSRPPADIIDHKIERAAMMTYDLAQIADLIDATRGTRMTITVILAVLCGLRRGEIAALRWRNIILGAAQLAVTESAEQTKAGVRYKKPKSGKGRTVALSARVVNELRSHRVQQAQELLLLGVPLTDDAFVVAQADGSPLQPRTITHQWHQLLANNKTLPRIRFHDLRHAHATHMLSSGVHPKIASERLGYSKVGITMDLYSHVIPGMQEDAAARVDRDLEDVINKRTKTIG